MSRLERNIRKLIVVMTQLKKDAANCGMFKTFKVLDEATKVAGWELADKLADKLKETT